MCCYCLLSWVQKYANNKSIQSPIPTKNASVPKHASEFLSQVAYILGTCTYVFEHARLLSVMNAKLIEDLMLPDNNFWTCVLIHVFSLVLSSSWWTSAEIFSHFSSPCFQQTFAASTLCWQAYFKVHAYPDISSSCKYPRVEAICEICFSSIHH